MENFMIRKILTPLVLALFYTASSFAYPTEPPWMDIEATSLATSTVNLHTSWSLDDFDISTDDFLVEMQVAIFSTTGSLSGNFFCYGEISGDCDHDVGEQDGLPARSYVARAHTIAFHWPVSLKCDSYACNADPALATVTEVFDEVNFTIMDSSTSVPEPSPAWLLLGGLATIGVLGRQASPSRTEKGRVCST